MIPVLHIISDTNIGGGGRSLLSYLQYYDRGRFWMEVAMPRGSALAERVRALDVPVHELDALADRSLDLAALAPLRRLIRQLEPRLVHTHGALTGRLAGRLEGRRVVYTKHCAFPPSGLLATPPGRLLNGLADGLLADGVLAVGPSARSILLASGIPDRRIHELLNGVAPLPAPTPAQREAARAAFGFGAGDFVAGILARVEEYKGHGTLLDAAERLLAQGRPIRLLVAGEGDFLPEVRRRAAALPPGSVVLAGFVREVERALWAMDVQVNASTISETSSLSLLEGMSLGLPALASRCGGNPSLIFPGENGLLFPPGDPEALAAGLARLMDRPEERSAMGRKAVELFQARFTGERYAEHIEKIYLDILKGDQ